MLPRWPASATSSCSAATGATRTAPGSQIVHDERNDSKVSGYDVVERTPYGKDVLKMPPRTDRLPLD